MELQEYINGLKTELSTTDSFDRNAVFITFEKYVKNKDKLRSVIDIGLFHYEYTKYKLLFEGTLFEDGIDYIIDIFGIALEKNAPECYRLFGQNYYEISKGYANFTQLLLTSDERSYPSRLDLFAKKSFNAISDGIENSMKPHLMFLYHLMNIVKGKNGVNYNPKLGQVVNELIQYSDVLNGLYYGLFFNISVSQWRNIGAHGDYSCRTDGSIEIEYGEKTKQKRIISREELTFVLNTLDAVLYMHKTVHTLLSVDYGEALDVSGVLSQKISDTLHDDVVAQIVETSYAYGLDLISIDDRTNEIIVEIRNDVIQKVALDKFLRLISAFLNGKYDMLISYKGKVKYQVNCYEHKIVAFEYLVKDK